MVQAALVLAQQTARLGSIRVAGGGLLGRSPVLHFDETLAALSNCR